MATATVLPSQADIMADIERVKARMAEPANQETAETAMAAAIQDPEFGVEQKLLEQVTALGDGAKKVDEAFARVSIDLGTIDNNNYLDQSGNPMKKLKPIWDGFHERFKRMLWDSRNTATQTATYVLTFFRIILPAIEETLQAASEPGVPYQDKKEMIEDIRKDVQRFIATPNPATQQSNRPVPPGANPYNVAEAHSQDFLDLKREIEAFKDTFGTFAAGTQTTISAEITTLTNKINSLTIEIAGYQKVVDGMAIAMGATAGGAAVAAGVAFFSGPWGPGISLAILIVGAMAVIGELATLVVYLEKKNDAEEELATAKTRKKTLEAELATLTAVKSKLATQTTDITFICDRLDKFANIWGMVSTNALEVDGLLVGAAEPAFTISVVSKKIAVLKASYGALYNGLKAYASNVSGSGIAQPAKTG